MSTALSESRLPRSTMFARSVRAEVSKEWSTGFQAGGAVLVSLVTLGVALGIGSVSRTADARWNSGQGILQPQFALVGLLTVGVVLLLLAAAWSVLGERVPRTAGLSAIAVPSRSVLVLSKTTVAAVGTLVLTAVLVPLALIVTASAAAGAIAWPSELLEAGGARFWLVLPFVLAAYAAMAVAVAALLDSVPLTIGVLLVWYLLVEDWLGRVPPLEAAASLLPVSAGLSLAGAQGDAAALPGGVAGGVAALVGATVLLVALACFRVERRDVRS
ncbi:hypothetical protein C5C52_03115 [Rathayibacter sp. AY1E5]|uniref:hypothetical protein n=1 Tax=Rathayibacter sp. AY1E5 TaxID=2080553 RepID=UPI000CE81D38|nr:hypothetical protein [Rathayibacter sp. AY1E5]PPG83287.1 hypothetical protein C5C52_03115 [Rathayibacter sp. AY1E5]